jgi:hypothetical protein
MTGSRSRTAGTCREPSRFAEAVAPLPVADVAQTGGGDGLPICVP